MKIISTNTDLSRQLIRLMEKYPNIAIATAWASANTDAFKTLIQHKNKIDLAVIGTHFYQTHPDVLDQFIGSSKVKFVLQPEGVFHPKVYLFWSEQAWEVVIGSPNLTAGALAKNSELSVLISSEDGRPEMRGEISTIIGDYWSKASTITEKEADNYRRIWKLKSRDLKRLSDFYGEKETTKPAVKSKVMSMDWASYVAEAKKDTIHGFDQRLEMLRVVKAQFDQYEHFNAIPLDARRGIAGLASKTITHWAWFGKMSVARSYAPLIKQEHPAFSLALDEIPQFGDVRKEHFDRYIKEYLKAFPNGGAGLATATRLLAMKRPDTFLCVDSKNKDYLSQDIGLVRVDKLDYERYWDEVILRVMDSPWWQCPEPSARKEKALWHARAAMLDAIFYEK